jgi:hypothetical protein
MWLPWQWACWIAVAVAAAGVGLRTYLPGRLVAVRALCLELPLLLLLYAVWQRVGELSLGDYQRASARGRWILDVERSLPLPSEVATQHLALHSEVLVRAANVYYIAGHAPALFAFLLWLWARHREDFARWRTTLGFASIVGCSIQAIPVAPPRLVLPGIVDTGLRYGPSVYEADGKGFAPQLAAMPSLHVAWAVVAGLGVFCLVRSRWRWVGLLHAVVTVLVVVVTGNHYWLDAIAGIALVGAGLLVHEGVLRARYRRGGAGGVVAQVTVAASAPRPDSLVG